MTTPFLTFAAAGAPCAIPLDRVREVVGCRTVVRVPNAGACVRGVMNLRGSVVPVFDLARRLGGGDTALSAMTCVVVMEADLDGENTPIAGLVEEIRGVVELTDDAMAAAPDFGTAVDRKLIRAVTNDGDSIAYVLDLDEILAGLT